MAVHDDGESTTSSVTVSYSTPGTSLLMQVPLYLTTSLQHVCRRAFMTAYGILENKMTNYNATKTLHTGQQCTDAAA